MKNRIVLTSLLLLSFFSAFAQSGKCGDNLTWTISDNTLSISGYGAMENYDNESSKAPWYAYRNSIVSAVLNEGITAIGSYAFVDCGSLTAIEIPASVTSIGDYAFSLCFVFPIGGELDDEGVFDMPQRRNGTAENTCNNLQSITCNAVTPPSLGENVFFGVNNTVQLYVPAQSIELYQAAEQWKNFSVNAITPKQFTVTFMDGNKVLAEQTVEYGHGATAPEVEIPLCHSLTWDKDFSYVTEDLVVRTVWSEEISASGICGADGNGSNLTWTLSCDNRLTISGNGTMKDYDVEFESRQAPWYAYRSSITSVVITEGVNSIGTYAFTNCRSLTTVEIPASVSYIGGNAFSLCFSLEYGGEIGENEGFDMPQRRNGPDNNSCNALQSITCNAVNPPALGSNVFFSLDQSIIALYVPAQSIDLYKAADQWEDFFFATDVPEQYTVTFMDGNTVLGEQTVEYGQAATAPEVEIPQCRALTWDKDFSYVTEDLVVQAIWTEVPTATGYCGAEGDGSNLTWTLSCDNILTISGNGAMKDYDIESSKAPWYAYRNSITSVVLSDGITTVGNYAFTDCTSLTTLEIPASVSYIGDYAFSLCLMFHIGGEMGGDEPFDMPQRRNSPEDNPCNALQSITCNAVNPPALGENVFLGVNKSIPLYVPTQSIDLYKAADQWKDFFETDTPAQYTITFMDEDGTVIDSRLWDYGTMPVCDEPTKQADAQYTYTFAGWTPEITEVTGNATYTATYNRTLNQYTVTFVNEDETVIDSRLWDYGTTPVCDEPTKQADAQYTYTFAGWTPEITEVTGNATYTATYNRTLNQYTVTFVNEDESVIDSRLWDYGTTPVCDEPTKQADAQYTYTFAGWTPEITEVTGNATYTATYNRTLNQYTVTFVNEDESVIDSRLWDYGTMPVCDEPTKQADAQYTYTFARWTPEITEVTGNATYTATYNRTLNQYTVTFVNEDESVIDSRLWDYGTMPVCDEPTKQADAQYTYTFAGWTPEIMEVTGNATYTATYNRTFRTYTVTFMDGNTVLGTPQTVAYGQAATAPEVEIPQCLSLAWDKDFSYITTDLTVLAVWTEAAMPTYSITAEDEMQGIIYIMKEPTCEDRTLIFRAGGATEDYEFLQWSDGVTDNPRTIDLTQDIELTAQFIYIDNSPYREGLGRFSVSATRQVKFSPGNLQYNAAQGSHLCSDGKMRAGTWRFATRQWSYVGNTTTGNVYTGATKSDNKEISSTYDGWTDLIGWGTGYNPTEARTNTAKYPDFTDWGLNVIHFDGMSYETGMWRTLTREEWVYLVHGRENATNLFGMGSVNGVNGFILLPDDWTTPEGMVFASAKEKGMRWYDDPGAYSLGSNHYSDNTYTLEEWLAMQAAGAVFMPAGGYRTGSHVNYASSHGFYWTSTSDTESNTVYNYEFRSSYFHAQNLNIRSNGFSVRLVWDIPVIGYTVTVLAEGEGTVTGGGVYEEGETATLTATPDEGYMFTQWSDGNTDNPRIVTVTGEATYTAVFEAMSHDCTIETTDEVTIWQNQLPYTWEGIEFTKEGTETKTLKTYDGCDSVVTFTLHVLYLDIVLQENESSEYYDWFKENYNGFKVSTVTLNRQFSQGKWSTLCLPFNVNKALMTALGMNGRVYEFRHSEQTESGVTEIYFSMAQSIEAGKGYIVNANAKLATRPSFVFPGVTIKADADTGDITTLTGYNDGSGKGTFYLVGTLRTGLLIGSENGNTYIGLKNNTLYAPNSVGGTQMLAYRGIFRSTEPFNSQRVRIIAEGQETVELIMNNGQWTMENVQAARKYIDNGILYIERNDKTYNAQGQSLD